MQTSTIAIIGSGNMGTSLVGGLIADGYPKDHLYLSDPSEERLQWLKQHYGVNTTSDNRHAVANADSVILAVKPQLLARVATEIAGSLSSTTLVISIAAGVTTDSLAQWLGNKTAIVRTMPNTPALVRAGATALYANAYVTESQRAMAESILRAVGVIVWLTDEKLMDAVTALSGSGPAYFFLIVEIMQQIGESMGLPSDVARLLTLQTGVGATHMALESNATLAELRQQVTSPGGTTASALAVFEKEGLATLLTHALKAARDRSEALSQLKGS